MSYYDFLEKPDYARARPSTLLNDEKTYQELYEKNNDLEVFYRVALLGKRIQKNVKSVSDYSPAEKVIFCTMCFMRLLPVY